MDHSPVRPVRPDPLRVIAPVLLALYVAVSAAATAVATRDTTIDYHESGYAYYAALLALQTRDAAGGQAAPVGIETFWRGFRSHYTWGNSLGMLGVLYALFLFFGKSLTALRLLYVVCVAAALVAVYRWGRYLGRDDREGRWIGLLAAAICAAAPALRPTSLWTVPEDAAALPLTLFAVLFAARSAVDTPVNKVAVAGAMIGALGLFKIHIPLLFGGLCVIHLAWRNRSHRGEAVRRAGAFALPAAAVWFAALAAVGWEKGLGWVFLKTGVAGIVVDGASFAETVRRIFEFGFGVDSFLRVGAAFAGPEGSLGSQAPFFPNLPAAVACALLLVVTAVLRRPRTSLPWMIAAGCTLLAVPAYYRIAGGTMDYLLPVFPFFALLAATALAAGIARARSYRRAAFAASVAAVTAFVWFAFARPFLSFEHVPVGPGQEGWTVYRPLGALVGRDAARPGIAFVVAGPPEFVRNHRGRRTLFWSVLDEREPFPVLHPDNVEDVDIIADQDGAAGRLGAFAQEAKTAGYGTLAVLAAGSAALGKVDAGVGPVGWSAVRSVQTGTWKNDLAVRWRLYRIEGANGDRRRLSPVICGYAIGAP